MHTNKNEDAVYFDLDNENEQAKKSNVKGIQKEASR
jgi:hypothetical protein